MIVLKCKELLGNDLFVTWELQPKLQIPGYRTDIKKKEEGRVGLLLVNESPSIPLLKQAGFCHENVSIAAND